MCSNNTVIEILFNQGEKMIANSLGKIFVHLIYIDNVCKMGAKAYSTSYYLPELVY